MVWELDLHLCVDMITEASILCENLLRYLSADITCFRKQAVFREQSLRRNVKLWGIDNVEDKKYLSIKLSNGSYSGLPLITFWLACNLDLHTHNKFGTSWMDFLSYSQVMFTEVQRCWQPRLLGSVTKKLFGTLWQSHVGCLNSYLHDVLGRYTCIWKDAESMP